MCNGYDFDAYFMETVAMSLASSIVIQYNTIQTCLFFNHTVHCIIAIIIQFDQKRGGQKK